jgi:hypothetical protein
MAYTTIDNPFKHFNTVLYTGNGSTQSITGVGYQPDWVWLKKRNDSDSHYFQDVVRGATKAIKSNSTDAEVTDTDSVTSFNSDGFSLGNSGGYNSNTNTFVAWNWKAGGTAVSNSDGSVTSSVSANTTSGLSICTFTATGSSMTFGHGLGVAPKLVIWKRRDSSTNGDWATSSDPQGWTNYMTLNNQTANQSGSSRFGSAPTSLLVTVGSETVSSGTYVAYCFAEKQGYSKIGTYIGNGSTDGAFIYTGFKPAFIIMKSTSHGVNWKVHDNKRDAFNNGLGASLSPNESSAEDDNTAYDIDLLSNGFKQRNNNANMNKSGYTYLYLAFAEAPVVTAGTKAAGTAR